MTLTKEDVKQIVRNELRRKEIPRLISLAADSMVTLEHNEILTQQSTEFSEEEKQESWTKTNHRITKIKDAITQLERELESLE